MKRTRVLGILLWAVALVLVLPSPAGASEETVGSCVVETIEELAAEGVEIEAVVEAAHASGASEEAEEALVEVEETLEKCLEAPSPIFPETNEIIWGGAAFAVLLAAMIKWGFPAVKTTMEARTEQIRSDLEAAETARTDAVKVKQQHEAEMAETRASVAKIIDASRQEAVGVRADLQVKAEADIAELRRQADVDMAAARQRALSDLQSEVNEIVVGAAERVIERNLDANTQKQLIDNYIASVGRR